MTDVGVSALREFHCAFGRDAWVMGQTDQDEVERESDHLYVDCCCNITNGGREDDCEKSKNRSAGIKER